MDSLRIKANKCKYQECDRCLKEKFITGINNKAMTFEIIKEFTEIKSISEVRSEQVIALIQRVEAQRSEKTRLATIHETKNLTWETHTKDQ